jgi:hypothetical protein
MTSSQYTKGDLRLVSERYSLMAFTSPIMQHVRLAILKHQICLFSLLRRDAYSKTQELKTSQAEVVLRLAFSSCNGMFDLNVNIGS